MGLPRKPSSKVMGFFCQGWKNAGEKGSGDGRLENRDAPLFVCWILPLWDRAAPGGGSGQATGKGRGVVALVVAAPITTARGGVV